MTNKNNQTAKIKMNINISTEDAAEKSIEHINREELQTREQSKSNRVNPIIDTNKYGEQ